MTDETHADRPGTGNRGRRGGSGGRPRAAGRAAAGSAERGGAYDRALTMLTARAYATEELRRRLVRKGFDRADVDAAVARLTAAGLLDDAAFARQLTRSKVLGGAAAARRVRQMLAARGVAREVADEAVSDVLADEEIDQTALAEAVARRRLAALAGLDPAIQRRRLYAYLARRGYEVDEVRRVVERVMKGGD